MSECPECGSRVYNPTKIWSMVGNPNNNGERFKLTLGIFDCSSCDKKFRAVVKKERITLNGIVKEIKVIEKGLGQTLSELHKKVDELKNERAELLKEIENLKIVGEKKTEILEKEVASLREELESLKEILEEFE
ncbi:MAG: hypothetical protein P8Y18_08885 [Candidatus Bathyarchaeota archaeon]